MRWLRQEVALLCLAVLIIRFVTAAEISAALAWAIVVLAIAVISEDYVPLPNAPQDAAQEQLDEISNTIRANHEIALNRIAGYEKQTDEKLKELKNSVSSATLAAGLRPRQPVPAGESR